MPPCLQFPHQPVPELLGRELDQSVCTLGGISSGREHMEPSRMDLPGKGPAVCSVRPGLRISTLVFQGHLRIGASQVPTAWRPWPCLAEALACLRLLGSLGHP